MTKLIGAQTLEDALCALGGLIAENEEKGEKSFIFCEDKVTLLAERAVLDAVGATFLTEVTTFARFLSSDRHVLSKQGSVMAISQIIARANRNCIVFIKMRRRPSMRRLRNSRLPAWEQNFSEREPTRRTERFGENLSILR